MVKILKNCKKHGNYSNAIAKPFAKKEILNSYFGH
jgi:hypothetical protein